MDFSLNDEQRAFERRFRTFCDERIAPRAAMVDREQVVPAATWKELADAGFLALFHPTSLGGTGADGITQGLAMEALARACASTFWTVGISTVLCGKMLQELCGPVHHEKWLRPIISGEKIGAFAASEQGAGSDPGSYRTTLRRTPQGFRLSGEKMRISNAGNADVAVVLARLDDPTGPAVCYCVVDLHHPRVLRREHPKLGLQGMSWGALQFDDVEIAPEDVITNASIEKTLVSVEWGQLLQTWCAIGIAEAALDACRAYVTKREAFGRPIGHLERVHARLAQMHADIDASRLLALEVSWTKGQGRPAREAVLMAKIHATELAVRVADDAMRTFGGWGYTREFPIERLYRDAIANVPAGLPTDRLRELLSCAMLGVDPWKYDAFDWLEPAGLRLGA